jgi:bacillithiol system protein YtxJ
VFHHGEEAAQPPTKTTLNLNGLFFVALHKKAIMNWISLTSEEQLAQIQEASFLKPQVIFKHSTRCSISSTALHRLERAEAPADIDFYYLDLIQYRSLSAKVAEVFKVKHESPQILLIKNGQCVYNESHFAIAMEEIVENALSH